MITRILTGATVAGLGGICLVANATLGFRCGGHIIDVGDSEATLIEHCGEPSSREGYRLLYDRGRKRI